MIWIYDHQRNWRVVLFIVMVVAFMGPWAYDLINVPSEYECSAPNIRLEGDFCGIPLSGIRFILWFSGGLISISASILTGEYQFSERLREFLITWLLLFPLLPFISTLLLIGRGNNRRRQIFTIFAWVMAIGGGLFFGLNNYPEIFWVVWGIWLFTMLAVSALILETLLLVTERKLNQKS